MPGILTLQPKSSIFNQNGLELLLKKEAESFPVRWYYPHRATTQPVNDSDPNY